MGSYIIGIGIINFLGKSLESIVKRVIEEREIVPNQHWNHNFLRSKISFIIDKVTDNKALYLITHAINEAKRDCHQEIRKILQSPLIIATSTLGTEELLKFLREGNYSYLPLYYGIVPDLKRELNWQGPIIVISTACSSGIYAIYIGTKLLSIFEYVTVATVDTVNLFVQAGFDCLGATSQKKPLPFSQLRDGLVLGEGATAVILSRTPKHKNIGITGIGLSSDGYSLVSPEPEGEGLVFAIKKALEQTEDKLPEVVIAHATATLKGDLSEAIAYSRIFYERNFLPKVSFFKGSIGHTMANSALNDFAFGIWMISNKVLFNGVTKSPLIKELKLEPVIGIEKREIKKVMVVASGFGGSNGVMIIEKTQNQFPGDLEEKKANSSPLFINGISYYYQSRLYYWNNLESFSTAFSSLICDKIILGEEKIKFTPYYYKLDYISRVAYKLTYPFRDKVKKETFIIVGTEFASWENNCKLGYELVENISSPKLIPRVFAHTAPNAVSGQLTVILNTTGPAITFISKTGGIEGILLASLVKEYKNFLICMVEPIDSFREKLERLRTKEDNKSLLDIGIALTISKEPAQEGYIAKIKGCSILSENNIENNKPPLFKKYFLGSLEGGLSLLMGLSQLQYSPQVNIDIWNQYCNTGYRITAER